MTTTTTTSSMSPREIDEILADLYANLYRAEDDLDAAWRSVHYAANDRLVGIGRFASTHAQAFAAAQAKIATALPYRQAEIQSSLDKIAEREAAVAAALAAIKPYADEYARRPWSRFFVVEDGHIHSSMSCATCNKGRTATRFGWNPMLSGKSMADAIAHFEAQAKGRSEVLCSVCYPDAPREWMVKPADPNQCAGSGTTDYVEGTLRKGFASGNGAECSHCGQWKAVSSRGYGKIVKHRK